MAKLKTSWIKADVFREMGKLKTGIFPFNTFNSINENNREIEHANFIPIESKIELINSVIKETFYTVKENINEDGDTVEELVFTGYNVYKFEIMSKFYIFNAYVKNVTLPKSGGDVDIIGIYNVITASGLYNELLGIEDVRLTIDLIKQKVEEEKESRNIDIIETFSKYMIIEELRKEEELTALRIQNKQSNKLLEVMPDTVEGMAEMMDTLKIDVDGLSDLKNYDAIINAAKVNDMPEKIKDI